MELDLVLACLRVPVLVDALVAGLGAAQPPDPLSCTTLAARDLAALAVALCLPCAADPAGAGVHSPEMAELWCAAARALSPALPADLGAGQALAAVRAAVARDPLRRRKMCLTEAKSTYRLNDKDLAASGRPA